MFRLAVLTSCVFLLAGVESAMALTQSELREFTEMAIRNRTVLFEPPEFDWSGRVLRLNFGGVVNGTPAGADKDPLQRIVQCQFMLSGIRMYRSEPNQRFFWDPVLKQAEKRVTEMLRLVQSQTTDKENIRGLIAEEERLLWAEVHEALIKLAKENGKDGIAAPAPWKQWSVKIAVPTGATVQYMNRGDFELYQFRKEKGESVTQPPWETILDNTASINLGGAYWFKVTLADGKQVRVQYDVKEADQGKMIRLVR